jgi:carboxyl-terminal processing protease
VKKRQIILLSSLGLALAAALSYAQIRSYKAGDLGISPEAQALVQVFQSIKGQYLKDVDSAVLLRGAIGGMLGALDDPFTSYSTPEETKGDEEQLSGQFFGIGVLLKPVNADGTGSQAQSVYKDQPGAKAGLQPDDIFYKINGEDVSKLKPSQIVTKIRGPKGTKVKLEVLRAGSLFSFEATRDEIKLFAVTSEVLPNGVGYLSVNTFYNQQIFDQFDVALKKLKDAGVKKMILDLRDNGGGLLCAGTYIADRFLAKGNIVSLRDRTGHETLYGGLDGQCSSVAKPAAADYTGDLVVLVNKNSASASEIVAGALQDLGRAKIIGETSYGKGVAQTVFKVKDGGEVRLVNQEWLTPKGRAIQKKGITPDVMVEDTRYGKTFNIDGVGAKPGQKLTVLMGGERISLTADKDGSFKYTKLPPRPETSSVQGESKADLKGDAELKKALELLQMTANTAQAGKKPRG